MANILKVGGGKPFDLTKLTWENNTNTSYINPSAGINFNLDKGTYLFIIAISRGASKGSITSFSFNGTVTLLSSKQLAGGNGTVNGSGSSNLFVYKLESRISQTANVKPQLEYVAMAWSKID